MKKIFGEFKEFIKRGNVLDMAVGVVIGSAFGSIVTSIVNDIIMPLIGLITKGSFENLFVALDGNEYATLAAAQEAGANVLSYGVFISAIINFIIMAFVIFLIVKSINKLNDKSLSASVAYASPNGALLDNVYNSGRSGYAASAYINNNVTGNVTKWNNTQTAVAGMSGVAHFYKSYNPNWWNSTASNPLSIKIYTANFCSAGGVSDAHLYLQQVQGDLSSYNITMKITGWKSNGTWTTKQFATLGSHYFSDNSLTPVFSEWTQNSRINIIPGGWDTACNCILLAGGDSAGETLRINWHGYVGG